MKLQEIKEKLRDCDLIKVSFKTGLHYTTLYKLATGRNGNPTLKTIEKLSEYFKENE